jgi:excinuclease ABC subunit C
MSLNTKKIKQIVNALPINPGVYQYYNNEGNLLYIGKAKNIKNRVRSYFSGEQSAKTKVLVGKIKDIKFIIVPTEQDALLLENNLIKQYKPPFNILLKDDKTYPWICIKKERFPRIFSTRKVNKDGSIYFGPYTSVKMVNTLLELISKIFPLRNCNFNLSETNIKSDKFKVCLEFHLGNCEAPCIGKEKLNHYDNKIKQIEKILKGNIIDVKEYLIEEMRIKSLELDFESAQSLKESLLQIEKYQIKNTVVSSTISNVDVFGFIKLKDRSFVNYFKIIDGSIIQSHTAEAKIKLQESNEDILIHYILNLREDFKSNSKEILIPYSIDFKIPGVKIITPKIGEKKKLVDLSIRNAKFYGLEKIKSNITPTLPNERILKEIMVNLHLKSLPRHIECFDNSNIQGTNPVSACVVFKDAKPAKSEYRHFNIKTVDGPNDFASMEEVLFRRYKRLLNENKQLPNLIIIDGGKGQLSASVKTLKQLGIYEKIAVIGIAKRLEEIFFPNDQIPIYLDKKCETLKVIQHLRNEAHRFSIKHHRNRRSNSMVRSELDIIPGIGEKTRDLLLKEFKSVSKLKNVKEKQLVKVVGKHKAKIIVEYLSK